MRDRTKDERSAVDAHYDVGKEVRSTVKKLGGTMPEVFKPETSIKKIVAARKKFAKKTAAAAKKALKVTPAE